MGRILDFEAKTTKYNLGEIFDVYTDLGIVNNDSTIWVSPKYNVDEQKDLDPQILYCKDNKEYKKWFKEIIYSHNKDISINFGTIFQNNLHDNHILMRYQMIKENEFLLSFDLSMYRKALLDNSKLTDSLSDYPGVLITDWTHYLDLLIVPLYKNRLIDNHSIYEGY